MNIHDATEQAYKNGYAQGKADAAKKIEDLEGDLEVWRQNRFNIFQTTECYERARRQAAGEIFEEIEKLILRYYNDEWYTVPDMGCDVEMLKKKYTEEKR